MVGHETVGPRPAGAGSSAVRLPGAAPPPAAALAGLPTLRIVSAWNPATGQWSRFIPGGPSFLNTLPTLKQGLSYWFIATGAGSVPFKP